MRNNLGYWTGKTYQVEGEMFLSCESMKSESVKVYKSEKTAENAAIKLKNRFGLAEYRIESC